MTETNNVYKVLGISGWKMKTFESDAEMQDFVKHNARRIECIFIELAFYPGTNFCDINILEETENGMEYVTHANLLMSEQDDEVSFRWGEDGICNSPKFPTVNKALKHYLKRKQEEAERQEEENARYSIYDVYSPRELL